jgi:hypothetical protein
VIVRFPNGGVAEVQIIPEPIRQFARTESHRLYEAWQNETDPAKRDAIEQQMKDRYAELLADTPFSADGNLVAKASAESSSPLNTAMAANADGLPSDLAGNRETPPLGDQREAEPSSSTTTAESSQSKNLGTDTSDVNIGEGQPDSNTYRTSEEGAQSNIVDLLKPFDDDLAAVEKIRACL